MTNNTGEVSRARERVCERERERESERKRERETEKTRESESETDKPRQCWNRGERREPDSRAAGIGPADYCCEEGGGGIQGSSSKENALGPP